MPTKKPRGYPLTPELLLQFRDAALANADDLIIEAGTLSQSAHHARAYFLAVAAIEEIGKAVQAAQGLARNLSDAAVRTKLQIQFEAHYNKATSAFIPWMLTESTSGPRFWVS
jgi:AbiV family abortive infection protein